jgi:hypothetical protein
MSDQDHLDKCYHHLHEAEGIVRELEDEHPSRIVDLFKAEMNRLRGEIERLEQALGVNNLYLNITGELNHG